MTITFPTFENIAQRMMADIANYLPEVDPTISGSFVNGLALSNAGRHYDAVLLVAQVLKQLFPQTSTDEFLELWAQYEGLTRIAAQPSTGYITITGVASTLVSTGTQWRTANSIIVSSQADATIATISLAVSSLTRSGTTVMVTTTSNHNLATNLDVTISGANESDYNGTFEITVTGETTFTYEISTTPSTPGTGTILAGIDGASVQVESDGTGAETNLSSGAELQLTTPIIDVDDYAYVQYLGLTGGSDKESDLSLLDRTLFSRANPVANFNESAIILKAKTIPGVTRVFVNRITPYVGAVTVSFMRDDDADPIPDSGEVADVRAALLEILPAQTDPNDLVVIAPTKVTVDFVFTAMSPDTLTMRTAITNNLTVYFDEEVTFETDLDEDKYRAVIIDTYDDATGDSLQTFTLSSPSGDVTISTNEIGVLGTITFP